MLTVGYGDIHPVTSQEEVFGIISIIIACCVFAYTMSVIGTVLGHLEESDIKMKFLLLEN